MKQILKVIVGSQAHGLATPESDFDYRGVFVNPTKEILSLRGSPKHTSWIEGKDDDTSWEIGHFLHLATHCNPTILETFLAPINWTEDSNGLLTSEALDCTTEGHKLRELFPYVWNSKGVHDAFTGYGFNQRKKFLEDKDQRGSKYAAAYLRTLVNAWELLETGTFTVRIADLPIGQTVRKWKNGNWSYGEVIDTCYVWQLKVAEAYKNNPDKQTNLEAVDEFLLDVRKNNW